MNAVAAVSTFKYTILRELENGLTLCRLDDPHQADEFFCAPQLETCIRVSETDFVVLIRRRDGLVKS